MALAMIMATLPVCKAQSFVVKNDALYDALLIPNIGIEMKTGARTTLDLECTYDPISFPADRKWKNWSMESEFRIWKCIPFWKTFVGINGVAGGFNIAHIPLFKLDERRIQGAFYGGGLTVGNYYIISTHWGMETKVNVDFVHVYYSRYRCSKYDYKETSKERNYLAPTRISLSFVYMIK